MLEAFPEVQFHIPRDALCREGECLPTLCTVERPSPGDETPTHVLQPSACRRDNFDGGVISQ